MKKIMRNLTLRQIKQSLSLHPIDPLCDVGQHFGGNGFFDVAVFGRETGLAMLEEVVE